MHDMSNQDAAAWHDQQTKLSHHDGRCWCGAAIPLRRKVYCSKDCRIRFRNSRVMRTPATCVRCAKPFMARLQSVRAGAGMYCSRRCRAEHDKATGRLAGSNGPRWIDGRSTSIKMRRPAQIAARRAVKAALRDGSLVRAPCERCGSVVGIHAHHDDYGRPIDVHWLCAKHHAAVHRDLRSAGIRSATAPRKDEPR